MKWPVLPLMLMVACAPMPGRDGGTPVVEPVDAAIDAGALAVDAGHDAGRFDAGEREPDGGPREPNTATQVLYTDDFERYASTIALKSSYGDQREQGATLSLDTLTAAAGTKSLRVDYFGDGGCADTDVFVSKVLAVTNPRTVVARFSVRFEQGFVFSADETSCGARGALTTGFVIGRITNAPGTVVLAATREADGVRWHVEVKDLRAMPQPHVRFRQDLRVNRLGPIAIANGAWHRLTLLVQRESQAGRGDGTVRLWVDGETVIDRDDGAVTSGTAPFGSITYPSVVPAGPRRPQTQWLDEVLLFEP